MIVILCDGSSKGNPGPASIGIIIWERINNPRIIRPTKRISLPIGIKTNMEAEWMALISATEIAFKHLNEEAYIFCDSQTVVKQANGIWNVKHENIKALYKQFKTWKTDRMNIAWVPRQLIYLADKEAQKGSDS